MIRWFRRSAVSFAERAALRRALGGAGAVQAEWCFYIDTEAPLSNTDLTRLRWLLGETFDPAGLRTDSHIHDYPTIIEIGPRPDVETPWSSTARAIAGDLGISGIRRLERARRFGLADRLNSAVRARVEGALHDRMTQEVYHEPPTSFGPARSPEPVRVIDVLASGREGLVAANRELGLAMDDHDIDRYVDLFANRLQRNPTDVELFALGQGNSEHSRHGFFRGNLELDGTSLDTSLMKIVQQPWRDSPEASVIAFHDDSSAVRGGEVPAFIPEDPTAPSRFVLQQATLHPTLTAETHNFPTGIAPYPGAATGTGGRIRDNQSVGRGGLVLASGVGYAVGNLRIPGYEMPWEERDPTRPANLAAPLDILIQGSNGASDYGNCFGEPVILGHVRTFGMDTPDGYRAWLKPVMYSAGTGLIDERHTEKGSPAPEMLVVLIGGPGYRIGMGGGAASSLVTGTNDAALDFNAVQRGDPEMEQRLGRVVRACIELGDHNPIVSAHDLGAGGASNALPEIVDPAGGLIQVRSIPVADASLSVLEIWGNESQERNAILIRPAHQDLLERIAAREQVPLAFVGRVTGDGRLVLEDEQSQTRPVNVPLEPMLHEAAKRTTSISTHPTSPDPLVLPAELTATAAFIRVMRLVGVGSKGWLVRKVDRSVTGLVAQQQTVGPLGTPLSDYAVMAHSWFGFSGTVVSHGERPLVGMISPEAQGRLTVAEALLNMAGAAIGDVRTIRASANWMWAAKLEGEGARLHAAAQAMSDLMRAIGMAVDGGKDSLSMAAATPGGTVKAPGQLVVAPYAYMPDVRRKVTPDFKQAGHLVVWLDVSGGQARLGGSALAQTLSHLGTDHPDIDDAAKLVALFELIQRWVVSDKLWAVHDISDGGLAITLAEMALAGNLGIEASLAEHAAPLARLFAEEPGVVAEIAERDWPLLEAEARLAGVAATRVGVTGAAGSGFRLGVGESALIDLPLHIVRKHWEKTSSELEMLQANPDCIASETERLALPQTDPKWKLSFEPTPGLVPDARAGQDRLVAAPPRVAVLRAAGTNGDREMAAAFAAAGFEVWDITMTDLRSGRASLADIQGVAFPGGFSYGDVLDAGKGWAGAIRFDPKLASEFENFFHRPDTFSFGVCNGAQLMALLGWTNPPDLPEDARPRFITNASGRFESRFVNVEILESPAIMLKGMAGSRLGVWVAHGEGRLVLPDPAYERAVREGSLAPIRFTTGHGRVTERYPDNPNGSPDGITALCSSDGRHLAMMPHPERTAHQMWQWPWAPEAWQDFPSSPWLKMFQNAYHWCIRAER